MSNKIKKTRPGVEEVNQEKIARIVAQQANRLKNSESKQIEKEDVKW